MNAGLKHRYPFPASPLLVAGFALAFALCPVFAPLLFSATPAPVVIEVKLDDEVEPISAAHVTRAIAYANEIHANAVLITMDTPGGLETSMRSIVDAILQSRVPVIVYVYPSGSRGASAGFFILVSADLAVMAPGTHAGAAHPVLMTGMDVGKTMNTKIENDAAAYIRSIAQRRGRNAQLAEAGVRESRSYTEQEALAGNLIDAVADSPQEIFAKFDGKVIKRFDGSTTTLHLAGATIQPYELTSREKLLLYLVDPDFAFLLGALGVLCLYVEFTHPGMVLPGVVGSIAVVLALFGFHFLPINYAGVVLILLALVLFALEAKVTSHGILAAGGAVAMIVGSMILINSPLPGSGIHLSTSLSVTLPLAVITVILVRLAVMAKRQKLVTGDVGMVDSVGVAQTELDPQGEIMVRGELWSAHARTKIAKGKQVRVRRVDGLTLEVEPVDESR